MCAILVMSIAHYKLVMLLVGVHAQKRATEMRATNIIAEALM